MKDIKGRLGLSKGILIPLKFVLIVTPNVFFRRHQPSLLQMAAVEAECNASPKLKTCTKKEADGTASSKQKRDVKKKTFSDASAKQKVDMKNGAYNKAPAKEGEDMEILAEGNDVSQGTEDIHSQ